MVGEFVEYYNCQRLHSAIGYIAAVDRLEGREDQILKERERKLEKARRKRALHHQTQNAVKQAA